MAFSPRTVRQDDGEWAEYVALCRAAGTDASEQVRQLVRWQLGKAGVKAPRRLRGQDSGVAVGGRVRESGVVAIAACGTQAGYRRHKRNGEPVDDACNEANNRAARELRARRKAQG